MANTEKGNIHDLMKSRWSPRAFSDREIDSGTLRRLFEAARWSPSSYNEQPWRFIVGLKGDESYRKIMDSLGQFNRDWAHTAPVLVLALAKNDFSKNGKVNNHARYDLGQSVAHLSLQAMHEEIFVHQMAGFSAEKARENFSLPEGIDPVTAVALGYLGDRSSLPEDLAKKESPESKRKELDQLVFTDGLENSFDF